MSNQACLFAEDTATPYDPFAEEDDPRANTVQVAGASYQVPAFWLFCFDTGDTVSVESEEGTIPALVSDMAKVRSRLAERDEFAKALFPGYNAAWDEFRGAVETVDRKYLKVDAYEIWMIDGEEGEFGRHLKKALNWFRSKKKPDLDALLALAGIEGYDRKVKTFTIPEGDDPERFLYGWLED
jgi:hypothetical protein